MPLVDLAQEEHQGFENHPVYQQLFQALVASGQTRDQAAQVLADVQLRDTHENACQQQPPLQPGQPQQQPDDNAPQQEQAEQELIKPQE